MKILFYSDNLYPEISGISDSIIALGRALRARGHTVGFVGPRYSRANYAYVGQTPESPSPLDGFEVYRIPSVSFGAAASGAARFVAPLGFSLRFAKKFKPDVIHTQSPFGVGIEALYAARACGARLIGTNHTIIEQFIEIYGPIRTTWAISLTKKFFMWYYNRMDFVSAPSAALVEDMRTHGLIPPSETVSNPTSLSLFLPPLPGEKEMLKKTLGLMGKVVIFSGRLAIEKNVDLLIEALGALVPKYPLIKLVIAGNGPIEAKLKELVRQNDLVERVVFTGFLDHATLSKWYKASDVFAIMSPIETQCLSLMQAFASALPAVGANVGALTVHIRPEFGYVVPEKDIKALATALSKVLDNPYGAQVMGEKAREYVQAFSDGEVAKIWEKFYGQTSETI